MAKVKICGFTRVEDVRAACGLGVDMVGVILVPESPRNVSVEQARKLFAAVGPGVEKVAVFRPGGPEEAGEIARKLRPDYIQLHLTFPPSELLELREKIDARVIGVVAVSRGANRPAEILERSREVAEVSDFVLVDTKGPHGGGTGLTHDWSLSREVRYTVDKPVFLAGGLNASNVKRAMEAVRPYGVDVATGVESSPGKKDLKLMREFVQMVRGE